MCVHLPQSMASLSGPKGYGLAMMIDVLAGVLTGSAFGSSLNFEGDAHAAVKMPTAI